MSVTFTRTTIVPADPQQVFDASLNVDFHVESFADTGEQIIGGVDAGMMQHGDTVTWRARHFGLWWTMTSHISAMDAPHMFVDEQQSGPFARFHHEHRFAIHPSGTLMTDVVSFTAPLGFLGRIAEVLFLRRHMAALIDTRNAHLVAYVERTRT